MFLLRVAERLRLGAFGVAMASSFAVAPVQCSHDPDPNQRMEEEPGQALYELAQKFHDEGNERSRVETLEYIVKRFPSSRYANMAKLDLEKAKPAGSADSRP
jgi:outer membrane protein assembly factor BamD (BamD/ComL family)